MSMKDLCITIYNHQYCHAGEHRNPALSMIFWIHPEGYFAGLCNLKVICDRYED
jgi:hypothetical protein